MTKKQKLNKVAKVPIQWKRITVSVAEELYQVLEERAGLAGVSLSRYVFAVLGRKRVAIVPGLENLLYQLQEITKTLNAAKTDPVLLRDLVAAMNRSFRRYECSDIGLRYPGIEVNEAGNYEIKYRLKSKNLVEC